MTVPAVLHPSIVRVVRDHIRDTLEVQVGRKVPTVRPSRFVTVSRFGGTRGTEVSDLPIVGIEAWADNPDLAEDLAQLARQAVHALAGTVVGGMTFYRVTDVGGLNDLPHPSGHPRFVFSVQMHVRGAG